MPPVALTARWVATSSRAASCSIRRTPTRRADRRKAGRAPFATDLRRTGSGSPISWLGRRRAIRLRLPEHRRALRSGYCDVCREEVGAEPLCLVRPVDGTRAADAQRARIRAARAIPRGEIVPYFESSRSTSPPASSTASKSLRAGSIRPAG
ncbi:hypothetical protein DdX_21200 [Ditylenchus destructor]|uniref:Uncharacterized protein n=1 Tax=Ditylenchus destructor TaxID=166010 RepID=A0AAD4MFD3_9BILA|nr:hypothetical protein DdX_21200 [Ditylenchus destructor]